MECVLSRYGIIGIGGFGVSAISLLSCFFFHGGYVQSFLRWKLGGCMFIWLFSVGLGLWLAEALFVYMPVMDFAGG